VTASGRSSPLLEAHRRLEARLTDFAGWEMPLHYQGVVAEHNAVRTGVGVFDVSHLGKLRVRGDAAESALQIALTADVAALAPGEAGYSLVLTDDGGCVDDVFAYRIDEQEWLVVPNAANVEAVGDAITQSGSPVADEWDRWAILAVQGPASFSTFQRVFPESGAPALKLHSFSEIDVFGDRGLVARTGYTGERGFELYAPAAAAPRAFERLLETGATPVGLGARDTLRLEMGYALYGNELTTDINPLEANLSWTVAWDTDFRGRDALAAIRDRGPARRAFAVRCTGRGVPRRGQPVVRDGRRVGELTSGNYSPTLKTGIGLGLGPAPDQPRPGDRVAIEARGRAIEGAIVKPPFVSRSGGS
jgi:aminomethyltransferase